MIIYQGSGYTTWLYEMMKLKQMDWINKKIDHSTDLVLSVRVNKLEGDDSGA